MYLDPSVTDNVAIPHHFGEHYCSIYRNTSEQFASVLPFLIDGLIAHQKCVYVVDDRSVTELMDEFFRRGFPIRKYIDSKQFVLYTKKETYLSHGYFDADALISVISSIIRESYSDGYAGVRACGEMTWSLGQGGTTPEKLVAYESQLNAVFPSEPINLFCQYNETKFPREILTDVIRTHPKLYIYGSVYENTYFYTPPDWMSLSELSTARSAYAEMIREITTSHN